MLVDLLQVTTVDGLRLDGVLQSSESPTASSDGVDAWILIHGTGSNFYGSQLLEALATHLVRFGAAALRVNTRGHDLISTASGTSGESPQGAAFERIDECRYDLAAWLDVLAARGFLRIGLLGHSLGALKAIYVLAHDAPATVVRLVAVSPPRLSYSFFQQHPRAQEFRQTFASAEELVRDGRGETLLRVRFPVGYFVTAASYLARYGPHERYNVLPYVQHVGCPLLVTFGSEELIEVPFEGLPQALEPLRTSANKLQVTIVAHANHSYAGAEDALATQIERWLQTP